MPVKNYVSKRISVSSGDFTTGDVVDKPPSGFHVTKFDIFALIYSIIVHIVDVGFDINVACHYYRSQHYVYFGLTIVFMLVPALLVTLLSLRMYVVDGDKASVSGNAVRRVFICPLVFVLQLAPVMRYCDSLNYALRSRRAEKEGDNNKKEMFYRLMLNEDSDVALLRVFECYLESAPQQILQISLLLIESGKGSSFHAIQQALSIASSFLSMAWCMASYHRSIRFEQDNRNNITWTGTSVQFLWHLNITISRILAISVLAALSPTWTCLAVFFHWLLMTVWLSFIDNTAFCGKSPFAEVFFAASLGLVYIFNYIGIRSGPSRYKYAVYYPVCLLENVSAVAAWAVLAGDSSRSTWYFLPLIIVPILTFFLAMLFLILYYLFFHPSKFRGVEEHDGHELAVCLPQPVDNPKRPPLLAKLDS